MKLREWRQHKKDAKIFGVKPTKQTRFEVYKRLIDMYGIDSVLSHVSLISKILDNDY